MRPPAKLSVAKYHKLKWDPLKTMKKFHAKTTGKGDPLVSPGTLFYAEKINKPFDSVPQTKWSKLTP